MTKTPQDRDRRLEEIFEGALALKGIERARYLNVACEGDDSLRKEIEDLLDCDEAPPSDFLKSPVVEKFPTLSDGVSNGVEVDSTSQLNRFMVSVPGGSYRPLEQVARGGMGIVFRVHDQKLNRDLAMKVMATRGESGNPQSPSSASAERRFLCEAQVTGQLDHPGIVPVHDLGRDDEGNAFFTMQLVRGETLQSILTERASRSTEWSQARLLQVVLRACEAVAFAHSRGVLHRDLKPANIMVGRFGETYVMDWGLAKVIGQADGHDLRLDEENLEPDGDSSALQTMDGTVIGTPAYMSPEQAHGRLTTIDKGTDVYGMGAILYHLLSGRMPYEGTQRTPSSHHVLQMVKGGPPESLHSLPQPPSAELVAITEKAMSRDPSERYNGMKEMADDLRAYLENRVVAAHRTGAWVEFSKWTQRNRGIAASVTVTIVTAILGLAAFGYSEQRGREQASIKEQEAQRHLDDYRRMADVRIVAELERQAETDLWPLRPRVLADMNRWLTRAEALDERREAHRQTLNRWREGGIQDAEGQWNFESAEEEWRHSVLDDLNQRLDRLFDPDWGTYLEIQKRIDRTKFIEKTTLEEYVDEWEVAIEEIRDSPLYNGLEIEPQVGLVPLGPDPFTELWEFWVWESGEEPVLDEEVERYCLDGDSGIVMVLLPGGSFFMGAQSLRRDEANYDPDARPDDGPVHEIELAPFFLSKFETTQGQYERLMDVNTSFEHEGKSGSEITPAHPVENLNLHQARKFAERLGLSVPTEAQWEYAARAGTQEPWWSGEDPARLADAANLADRQWMKHRGTEGFSFENWDDQFRLHAPVGSFAPNPFGLFDVIGNVWEWVDDPFAPYVNDVREGDGLREPYGNPNAIVRGGAFCDTANRARVSFRLPNGPSSTMSIVGVRLAKAID